jgi:hypothetical protein
VQSVVSRTKHNLHTAEPCEKGAHVYSAACRPSAVGCKCTIPNVLFTITHHATTNPWHPSSEYQPFSIFSFIDFLRIMHACLRAVAACIPSQRKGPRRNRKQLRIRNSHRSTFGPLNAIHPSSDLILCVAPFPISSYVPMGSPFPHSPAIRNPQLFPQNPKKKKTEFHLNLKGFMESLMRS